MKGFTKKLFTGLISMLIISCVVITAFAAVLPDINSKTTRIGSMANPEDCSATQGLTVTASGSNNRLFVCKANESLNKAVLYMYKDYTAMTNSSEDEYGTFILSGFVGHANGMAIDDNYIYITCWDSGNDYGNQNKIARISRSKLWSMYRSATATEKGTLNANSDGVTIISAVYDTGVAFNEKITAITYFKDGKFLINYTRDLAYPEIDYENETSDYFCYTTAEIVNGKLVVSSNKEDVFLVKYDTLNSKGQDIGYDPQCGFFIVRHLGGSANEIIWIKLNSLSGEKRIYKNDNSKYRIINVNKRTSIFRLYELESVSIGTDNHMYANVNTWTYNGYEQYAKDAIIRIERPTAVNGHTKFFGATITE